MNHWAQMLAELPVSAQRLIARTQRISLPRNADSEQRLLRLRQSLCRSATVRVVYAALEPPAQAALQELRALRGGLSPDALAERFGPVRSWTQMAADPQPHSLAEQLVLRGWLLLRPASPHHPAHYLLPPELRRWLPRPLSLADHGPAPSAPEPPILAAAVAALRLCQTRPLQLRANNTPTAVAIRRVAAHLAEHSTDQPTLIAFLLPLLLSAGLLVEQNQKATLTPGGQRFLTLAPAAQWAALHAAWLAQPTPDRLLEALLPNRRGIDWPLLRRRLLAWVDALPADRLLDPTTLFAALVATFGPLADPHTHGFRRVDRAPWQPRRAAAVWDAALRGPLSWFGYVAWPANDQAEAPQRCVHIADPAALLAAEPPQAPPPSTPSETVVIRDAVVVLAEPAVLTKAARSRSVQRHLSARLAPGVALVEREQVDGLTRALEHQQIDTTREGHVCEKGAPTIKGTALLPGECAVLLAACACYRQFGPATMPLLVDDRLEQQLWSALSPSLRATTVAAIAELTPPTPACRVAAPAERLSPAAALSLVRSALQRRSALTVRYDTGGVGNWSERTVRPLELTRQGGFWYLRAYCLLDSAERTFRVDRIGSAHPPRSPGAATGSRVSETTHHR